MYIRRSMARIQCSMPTFYNLGCAEIRLLNEPTIPTTNPKIQAPKPGPTIGYASDDSYLRYDRGHESMTKAGNSTSIGQIPCFASEMKGLSITVLSMTRLGDSSGLQSGRETRRVRPGQWSSCQHFNHVFRASLKGTKQRGACCLCQILLAHHIGSHDDIYTYHHWGKSSLCRRAA